MKKLLILTVTIGLFGISAIAQTRQPKTVRDFFMLLPAKYFSVECCQPRTKEVYLKKFLTVEDAANGYLEAGGDAAQNGFKMALFKRQNGSYVVGFNSFGEMEDSYYFLEFRGGKWLDVSKRVVPEYSEQKVYELPRRGTTVEVFSMKDIDRDLGFGEKDKKVYDLIWKNDAFTIKR